MPLGLNRPEHQKYRGWWLADIAEDMGKDWIDTAMDLVLNERQRVSTMYFLMSEENVAMQLAQPWIKLGTDAGKSEYDAVLDAAVSRLRPVVLAAATTVLGVIPLLQDVFWIGLAVVIMAGLSFGTVLTMVAVPVLYATFYRVEPPQAKG